MREIWMLQLRLEIKGGRRSMRVLSHPRFRAAYDFFELRAHAGNAPPEAAEWWARFQDASGDERERMLHADEGPKKKKRRRRGGKRRPEEGASPEEVAPGADE